MAKNFNKELNSYDNMFKNNQQIQQQENKSNAKEYGNDLEIKLLKPFSRHPFQLYTIEKLKDLANSINKNGVLSPIIVRPIEHDEYAYEIIAGHNRVKACSLLGMKTVPSIIKEVDDDTATIMMVDTNLQQRETILPSEKAFAYKYKFEAIKTKGKRNDLTSPQIATKLQADEKVALENNESKDTMYRYIRLTHLIKPILVLVDLRKMPFIPAVEISYLCESEQDDLYDIMRRDEINSITLKQAKLLKSASQTNRLSYKQIDKILSSKENQSIGNVKIPYIKIKDFFEKKATTKEVENTIIKALKAWFEQNSEVRHEN